MPDEVIFCFIDHYWQLNGDGGRSRFRVLEEFVNSPIRSLAYRRPTVMLPTLYVVNLILSS